MSKHAYWLLALLGVGLAFLGGYHAGHRAGPVEHELGLAVVSPPVSPVQVAPSEQWICPMHAEIRQDHPGTCPICGMDLVRHAKTAPHSVPEGVAVDAVLQQRLGVRLASVERRPLRREIRSWGTVALDESSLFEVSPKIDGWIRRLHVSSVGQAVRAGQPLYELYSPDLVQRQREYIEVMRRGDQLRESVGMTAGQNAEMLASLARERMRLRRQFENADIGNDVIRDIEQYRRPFEVVVIRATRSGVVTRIGAREGSYITPEVNLVSLADGSRIWIDIVLYPDQLAWVSAGDTVTAALQDGSGHEIRGRLQLPGTPLDPRSRSVHGRVVAKNPGQRLLPGTAVDVRIASAAREVLAVPRSALIPSGKGDVAMLARGDGHFTPVPVQAGVADEDYVEIVSGLVPGDQVAVKGQFLLDAAASLQSAAHRMRENP